MRISSSWLRKKGLVGGYCGSVVAALLLGRERGDFCSRQGLPTSPLPPLKWRLLTRILPCGIHRALCFFRFEQSRPSLPCILQPTCQDFSPTIPEAVGGVGKYTDRQTPQNEWLFKLFVGAKRAEKARWRRRRRHFFHLLPSSMSPLEQSKQ